MKYYSQAIRERPREAAAIVILLIVAIILKWKDLFIPLYWHELHELFSSLFLFTEKVPNDSPMSQHFHGIHFQFYILLQYLGMGHISLRIFCFLLALFAMTRPYALGVENGNPQMGLIGILLLFSNPSYYAHSSMCLMEEVLANLGIITIYYSLKDNKVPFVLWGCLLALAKESSLAYAVTFALMPFLNINTKIRKIFYFYPLIIIFYYLLATKFLFGNFTHFNYPAFFGFEKGTALNPPVFLDFFTSLIKRMMTTDYWYEAMKGFKIKVWDFQNLKLYLVLFFLSLILLCHRSERFFKLQHNFTKIEVYLILLLLSSLFYFLGISAITSSFSNRYWLPIYPTIFFSVAWMLSKLPKRIYIPLTLALVLFNLNFFEASNFPNDPAENIMNYRNISSLHKSTIIYLADRHKDELIFAEWPLNTLMKYTQAGATPFPLNSTVSLKEHPSVIIKTTTMVHGNENAEIDEYISRNHFRLDHSIVESGLVVSIYVSPKLLGYLKKVKTTSKL